MTGRPVATDQPMTPEQGHRHVFVHWSHLEALCRRRFLKSENLAHEALLHVVDQLEADDWQRVRTWQGAGRFLAYLTTLASRLLTDFQRSGFGYFRKPKWLAELADPEWDRAYRLLIVEGYRRSEALEILLLSETHREAWFFEDVVTRILERCQARPQPGDRELSLEGTAEPRDESGEVGQEFEIHERELVEALEMCLVPPADAGRAPTERVGVLVERLRPHVCLSDEDRLLLRMRFLDGLNVSAIARMLQLSGDPYKRLERVLRQLRRAFLKAGLAETRVRRNSV